MKTNTISHTISMIIATAAIFVFIGIISAPSTVAACTTVSPCGGYPFPVPQYPVPQYMYFQNPAQNYINGLNYTPVVYPIPMYVQTGLNQYNPLLNAGSQTYPSLNYVPNGSTTAGTPVSGTYGYPTTSYYNQPTYGYNNGYAGNGYGNGGFVMTGGSQSGYNGYNSGPGASSGGFIRTSGY